jgi:hypothetical protein
MYELYQSKNSRGSIAEVWIDVDAKLCKKYYKVDGITCQGRRPVFNDIDAIYEKFENEIYWSKRLRSPYVLELYEHGELTDTEGFYLIQEYHGPDLMYYNHEKTLHTEFPDMNEQLIEMFKFFKEKNVHKINNSLTNIVGMNGKIKAFDFKYAVERSPITTHLELNGIQKWLAVMDRKLPLLLQEYV